MTGATGKCLCAKVLCGFLLPIYVRIVCNDSGCDATVVPMGAPHDGPNPVARRG